MISGSLDTIALHKFDRRRCYVFGNVYNTKRTRSFLLHATQIHNHTGFGYVRRAGAACTGAGTFRICGIPTYAPPTPRPDPAIAPPFTNTATVHQYRSPPLVPVHTRNMIRIRKSILSWSDVNARSVEAKHVIHMTTHIQTTSSYPGSQTHLSQYTACALLAVRRR
jgi:hypothetical protein